MMIDFRHQTCEHEAMHTNDEVRAAQIYPVTIRGEERHLSGALEGCITRYAIRMSDEKECRSWFRRIRKMEEAGKLDRVKLSAVIVDTLDNTKVLHVVAGGPLDLAAIGLTPEGAPLNV